MFSVPDKRSIAALIISGGLLVAGLPSPTMAAAPTPGQCSQAFGMNGPRLYVAQSPNATVRGIFDEPRSTASLVVHVPGSSESNIVRNDSLASDGVVWQATVNLSTATPGQTFVAWLEADGRVIDAVPGVVGAPAATLTFENQTATSPGPDIQIQEVSLDNGGFVAIHNNTARGDIIGVSTYLAPGHHENVTIRLKEEVPTQARLVAMPHFDDDCDSKFEFLMSGDDWPYLENGTDGYPVTAAATVRVPAQDQDATPTPEDTRTPTVAPETTPRPADTPIPATTMTPTDTATLTLTPTPSAGGDSGSDSDSGTLTPTKGRDGPGFSAILAVFAMLGAVLLAARHNE